VRGVPLPNYALHPIYRERTPIDDAVLQIPPGHDDFVREQHHEKIALILGEWNAALRRNPLETGALEKCFNPSFLGCVLQPIESTQVRPGSTPVDLRRLRFPTEPTLLTADFIKSFRSSVGVYSQVHVAEFQVTQIVAESNQLLTTVRYELVGAGPGFYREHRIGEWSISWEIAPNGAYSLLRWQAHDELRSRSSKPSFTDITDNSFGKNPSYKSQFLHGADFWRSVLDGATGIDIYGHNGLSVGDIDGDGLDDIYICQPAGLPNRLFRNRGDGTFEDITDSSGLGLLDNTACALFADITNSGRQDLVVVRANGPLLFLNQGNGKFQLKPDAFHFSVPPQGTFTGAAAADYNRDGLLDIYFCLYVYYQGADQYKYPSPYFAAENGPPNFMMHNNGDGTFRDVTAQCGLNKNNTRYSFCCGWSDYNRDGWPDLYVVNDFGRKNLYRNNGNGTFTDVAHESGVEDVGAGMSVCWFDYDNDGAEDLYVANMWTAAGERIAADPVFQKTAPNDIKALYRKHAMGNSLLRNTRDGFADVTATSGSGMGRWSWSSDAWDFDHDGFPDLYIANGMISGTTREDLNSFFWRQVIANSPNTAKPSAAYEQGWKAINELIRSGYTWSGFERNVVFTNDRNGAFIDVSGALGLDFIEDSRSFALADFDGDGRQEMLLKNRSAPQIRLIKNIISELPPALAFRLQGTKSNRDAIGASITIETSSGQQLKFLQAGSGFLSQHSKEIFFGLGETKGTVSALIRWPSGLVQNLGNLPPNHRIWVTEGSEPTRVEAFKPPHLSPAGPSHQLNDQPPPTVETWLLAPICAPDDQSLNLAAHRGKPIVLSFSNTVTLDGHLINVSQDVLAVYNLLFRNLFDNHRDLPLPTFFLIDDQGRIVKVYQGNVDAQTIQRDTANIPRDAAARLLKALPFPGVATSYEYGRNNLSLGSILFQRGYPDSAEPFFQSAFRDDPTSAEALYGLGSIYLKQSNNTKAQDCFERASLLKASYPETAPNTWNNLGILAARTGDTTKAIDYFKQALQLDPDHFVALQNLGNAYRQQKQWDLARESLEQALSIKPRDPEANYSLGMVYAQTNDPNKAYEYIQTALRERPAYPEALNNLGILYLRTRRRDEAVATFEKCIQIAPAFDQSYLNLARVYAIEGNLEKARATLQALLVQHPNHPAAQQALEQLH